MDYRFLDQGDERLLELSELPTQGGLAVALRTTGYDLEGDEVVELALCDLDGNVLFCQKVRPQNVEAWAPGEQSGGLGPADVQDAPELYQFEERISELFGDAAMVVALHGDFAKAMIEAGWVSLPDYPSFDLTEQFCAAHSTADSPLQPATAASLQGIAGYYGEGAPAGGTADEAALLARCYRHFVEEQSRQRADKGSAYWEAYEQRLAEEARHDAAALERERVQALKNMRVSALLWLCAAAVFYNLAVQIAVRGGEVSLSVMVAAVAVFFTYKWIRSLYLMYKLHKGVTGDVHF